MAPKLDLKTLLGGLILAVAVLTLIIVGYAVPAWKKKPPPPSPQGPTCKRDMDCDQSELCLGGRCTKKYIKPKFPWVLFGGVAAMVLAGLLVISWASIRNADASSRDVVTKQLLVGGGVTVAVLIAIVIMTYIIYLGVTKGVCPDKAPYDCPTGQTSICTEGTGYQWECQDAGRDCTTQTKPTCKYGDPECNTEGKWECPSGQCTPPNNPPPSFKCPDPDHNVPECSAETGFEWICHKKCDPKDKVACPSGQVSLCTADNNYKYKCYPIAPDVCSYISKPQCTDPQCVDSETGYKWVCPGGKTRQDVINERRLICDDYQNADDSKQTETICFTDSTKNIPIMPTIGVDCEGDNPFNSIGPEEEKALNNPQGNLGYVDPSNPNSTVVFYPYNLNKRIYSSTDNKNSKTHACIIYPGTGLAGPCQNGGVWKQNKPGESPEGVGHCECTGTDTGDFCQFTGTNICSGHGDPVALPRNNPPREWKRTDQALACKCKDGYDNLAHLKGPVSTNNPDCWGKTCPDGTNCLDQGNGVTCCPNKYKSYGCCQVGNATCCPDKMNCVAPGESCPPVNPAPG